MMTLTKGDEINALIFHIHHKFILIDAETDHPVIYTGSANMSNNSNYNNDENLIEIRHAPEIGKTYLAEFMRLYEHYRARVEFAKSEAAVGPKKLQLDSTANWCTEYYISGNPKCKSRITMVY
jgi:phosphatidylserine/phosphatidylglycerophosphate/cardiolipin synthase-like enzyme